MNNNKINILFILSSSRINKVGKSAIKCRITYNKNRKEFSTGLFIKPEYWDSQHQIAKPPNDENININTQLSLIKSKINKAFLMLQIKEEDFTVEDIYSLYKGKKSSKEYNVIEFFLNHFSRNFFFRNQFQNFWVNVFAIYIWKNKLLFNL